MKTTKKENDIYYKGYVIDRTTYSCITVFYCGDDVVFNTVEEAKKFIDEVEGE